MRRNKGFTLVELLVVMAIIAILASIVVPNVQRYIVRARVTRAIAEVNGMNMSLTAIVTDAGRGNMAQLLNRDAALWLFSDNEVRNNLPYPSEYAQGDHPNRPAAAMGWPAVLDYPERFNYMMFENASFVYSRISYDLLRLGRDSLRSESGAWAPLFISKDILAQLGTSYMDIGLDSWGGVYRVWPGPWRFSREGNAGGRWPIPFRTFTIEMGGGTFAVQKDNYVMAQENIGTMGIVEDWQTWPSQVNYPADANKSVFIWSYGANNRSSQMLYKATYAAGDPFDWFFTDSGEDIAGGDDINNWDQGASWQRFYN